MIKSFDSGKKIIDVYAPTSFGKTLVLNIFGRILAKEYDIKRVMFTSPQVNLIQTGNLFGIPKLVGKSNYPCVGTLDLEEAGCTADDCPFGSSQKTIYAGCVSCPYRNARKIFNLSDFAATTFSRFMVDPNIRMTTKAVMIDESTNLFDKMIGAASLKVPENFRNSKDLVESLENYRHTIERDVLTAAAICEKRKREVNSNGNPVNELKGLKTLRSSYKKAKRRLDACDNAIKYVKMGVPHAVITKEEEVLLRGLKEVKKVRNTWFEVLDAKEPFKKMIEPLDVVVLASGTPITDLIAEKGTYAEINSPHPIDKNRRMIYYTPVGSMSKQSRDSTIPGMSYRIIELHNIYRENTIVHAGSYAIANELYKIIGKSSNVILQDKNDREGSFSSWQNSEDCIFISVAMEQGLDLMGPKYPMNIIAKINFPYLGDEWVQKRNEFDSWFWYNKIAVVNTVQACGRTTRSPQDYSEIHILDSSFYGLYKRCKKMFPDWFVESLKM